ncbi:helicase POLQ-like isoform X2 [Palaemon carinicauda]|uniref:helicase POLQ-like isoform X2 n=1 Tax=Palaemon carinicauda TaxID=392227 RepID=UPI0035B5CF51
MQRSCVTSPPNRRSTRRSASFKDYDDKKQEISKENCEEGEDEKEIKMASPILGTKKQFTKGTSFSSQATFLRSDGVANHSSSPLRGRKCALSVKRLLSSPTSSSDQGSVHRKTIQRSEVSPCDKRTQNRGCSYPKKADLSPVLSRNSLLVESPLSSFTNKEDSLIESIDFDELDSMCLSVMSTPKSSVSFRKNKKVKVSERECTPKRIVNSLKENDKDHLSVKPINSTQKRTSKESPRNSRTVSKNCKKVIYKSCKENDGESCSKRTEESAIPEHVHNTSGVSLLGEFGDEDSPDLFEATPSSNNYIVSNSKGNNFESETDLFSDDIDLFQDSSDSKNKCEAKNENQQKNKEIVKNNLISKNLEAESKNFPVPREPMSTCASSIVSSTRNVTGESYSDDSQVSFSSTMESQPLIARLQGRLDGHQSSQTCAVIQTENERRAELVEAAVKEAEKIHKSGDEFELGPFFGLPSLAADVLRKQRGILDLYDWQKNCILEGIGSRNLLFSLPTSGGKTLVAEILMLRQLLLKKKDTLFILPYVALVQEKVHGISPFGVELGFLVEEYAGSRGSFPPKSGRRKRVLYIATIEKASGLVNSLLENGRIGELGLVVADELHMMGEKGGRGAILEGTLTKLRYAAPKIQLVAMSATIGNLQEMASFLDAKLFTGNFRPVALTEYVKIGDQIWELNSSAKTEEELLYKQRLCCFPYTREQKLLDTDMIGGLVGEVVPDHSCIVFCPTRRNCETLAELICQILPRPITKIKRSEKVSLYRAIVEEGGGKVCPTLRKTIPFGVAYHHSGLTEGERRLIEEGYLTGTLCCVCCTSTLAAGVNLPARRVILRSPYTGSEFLTPSRYKQMVGRAGRAGLDSCGESFLILQKKDIKLVIQIMENLRKKGLVRIKALAQEKKALPSSLLTFGSEGSDLKVTGNSSKEGSSMESVAEQSNQVITRPISDDDELSVSRLGNAAIRGNIDLDLAGRLYGDLIKTRENLAVNCYLHLLYLVVPYDIVSSVKVVPDVLYKAFLKLGEEELKVAKLLDITEGVLIKLTMGQKSKKISEIVLQRFYVALILHQLFQGTGIWEVSDHFHMHRGFTQQLLLASSSFSSCVQHFCQEMEELWAFRDLLCTFSRQLSGCCSAELLPLLDIPGVKMGRAKMLYKAGFHTLHDVANAEPRSLVENVEHLPYRTATQIINSAKMLLLEKAESLQGEAEEVLLGLNQVPTNARDVNAT